MNKWAHIENMVWAIVACIIASIAFYTTGSFHSLWVFIIVAWSINYPKSGKK